MPKHAHELVIFHEKLIKFRDADFRISIGIKSAENWLKNIFTMEGYMILKYFIIFLSKNYLFDIPI